jgi:serine/threonine protein kinase/Flp pilus assembly protein TadD
MSDSILVYDGSAEALMGVVVDDFLERLGRGERPDVEEYACRYPRLAAVLRQMLPALRALHLSAADGPRSADDLAAGVEPGSPLGDFRLVREVGRGGMGVVYEAVQLSLGRRVALKVLPFTAALDAGQLQRFKNEAQAAAHLHHANIVPVYAVGSQRGLHYYAMQFIEGQTLAALVEDLRQLAGLGPRRPGGPAPSLPASAVPAGAADTCKLAAGSTVHSTQGPAFFRTVAGLAAQAAGALEHAHGQGVVHRDVKPANLLLDVQGNLWVTDFGLARVQSDTRLTLTGDLMGTLRYMSPEQALAWPGGADHRSDVYSLGVTLYELLTLEPAFGGLDRQELLRQIAFEEPRPPRRVNRKVPAELETIVLKAMAKAPGERYATAGELADDLRRFLADEPIRARRPTAVQRARKWARRHRAVVGAAAAALLAALAVLAGSVGWVVRDRAARQAGVAADIEVALNAARRARGEGNWSQARAALQRADALLHHDAAGPDLAGRVGRLQRELAEEEAAGRLVARLEELRLLQATLNNDKFDLQRALPDYRQAFAEYGLRPDSMTVPEAAALLVGRPPVVRATLLAALDHWLILARFKKAPEAAWLDRVLAEADSDPWRRRVRAARAANDRRALEQLAQEVDAAAQPPEELFLLDISLRQRGAREGALTLLRRAQDAFPGDFWINHDLGQALEQCRPPRYEEAVRFLTAAVAIRPPSAGARLNLGFAFLELGRYDEAVGAFRRSIELKPDYGPAYHNLGTALAHQGRLDEAVAALRRAAELRPGHAAAHYDLGCALGRTGRDAEAAAAYRRAIELRPDCAQAHCNLGHVLRQQGEFGAALEAMRRGHELGSRLPAWPYPSGQWLEECRRMVELEGRLPALLRGEVHPAGPGAYREYAQLCAGKKYYATAARLWAEADLAGDWEAGYRYDAACAAVLAAAGRGVDAGRLDDSQRARWRVQALRWLRDDLAAYRELLRGAKPGRGERVRQAMLHWEYDPDLAGLRDPAALSGLPAAQRQQCQELWTQVRALLTETVLAGSVGPPRR